MLMLKSSDLLQTGADRAAGLRWIYADVTDSARDLARSHLCGPAAELALAESLAAVALLGADLEQPEETVSFQMKTTAPSDPSSSRPPSTAPCAASPPRRS